MESRVLASASGLRLLALACMVCAFGALPAQAGMTTPGNFSVSASGAATYSIPIQVPPGTAGVEPRLALNYSSQGGNGPLGMGWSLGGLSAITRCPATMAQDGVRGAVNFDGNDRFCLDGQRLILVAGSSYGMDGAEYRTEIESYAKVISHGNAGSGPAWFKVWTKAGEIREYGNTADSRIEAQGKTTALVWAMNRLQDRRGNYLAVSYTEDNLNGEFYPLRIDYTGHDSPAVAPGASVQFLYETRTDASLQFHAGSLMRAAKRLKEIRTYVGAQQVKTYRIAYDPASSTQHSRIATITECGYENSVEVCRPATAMGLDQTPEGNYTVLGFQTALDTCMLACGSWLAADVNGDGKADLVHITTNSGSITTWLSNGDGSFSIGGMASTVDTCLAACGSWRLGDVNGDGKMDLVHLRKDLSRFFVWLSNGDGTYAVIPWGDAALCNGACTENWKLADMDGDGRADLLDMRVQALAVHGPRAPPILAARSSLTHFSNGDGSFRTVEFTGFQYNCDLLVAACNSWWVADANGDGRSDIIYQGVSGSGMVDTWFSNGDGTYAHATYTAPPGTDNCSACGSWHIGDVNGDGKADLIHITVNPGQVMTWLSMGNGNYDIHGDVLADTETCSSCGSWQTGDMNGDGRADVVHFTTTPGQVKTWLSKGDGGYRVANFTSTGDGCLLACGLWQLGDANGDGKSDLIHITHIDGLVISWHTDSSAQDRVTSISTGFGAAIELSYRPLTDAAIYIKGNDAVYPVQDMQPALHVVSAVATPNGRGSSLHTNYLYHGLQADLSGRGILGFYWSKDSQVETGIEHLTAYHRNFPYAGSIYFTQKFLPGYGYQGLLGQVLYIPACLNPATGDDCSIVAGNRYFPYVQTIVEAGWDLDGTQLPIANTTNQYDRWGNATLVTVQHADGFAKTSNNVYDPANEANWILGRLTAASISSAAP